MTTRTYLPTLACLALCFSLLCGPLMSDGRCFAGGASMERRHFPDRSDSDTAPSSFRVRYAGLLRTPPVSGDMPAEIAQAYLYLDSLLRMPSLGNRVRGNGGAIEGDRHLIARMARSVYSVTDYDPAIFSQYADEVDGKSGMGYANSLRGIAGNLFTLIRDIVPERGDALYSMMLADYILRVRVVAIDSITDADNPEYNQYRATVEVLDTLKGRTFRNAGAPNGAATAAGAFIQFQYMPGNYLNPAETSIDRDAPAIPYRLTDPAFTTISGGFGMRGGQEAIVFLRHADYRADIGGSSYLLHLEPQASYNALPIVDGAVRDVNHVWSDNGKSSYGEWRERFMELRSAIMGG